MFVCVYYSAVWSAHSLLLCVRSVVCALLECNLNATTVEIPAPGTGVGATGDFRFACTIRLLTKTKVSYYLRKVVVVLPLFVLSIIS